MTKKDIINWDLIDKEKADFILNQAEKVMISANEAYNLLNKKIEDLRNIYITILCGLVFVPLVLNKTSHVLNALGIGVAASLIILFWAYRTRPFPSLGNSPEVLFKEKYNQGDITILMNSMSRTYIILIKHALKINGEKGRLINKSLFCFFITIFICLVLMIKGGQ